VVDVFRTMAYVLNTLPNIFGTKAFVPVKSLYIVKTIPLVLTTKARILRTIVYV